MRTNHVTFECKYDSVMSHLNKASHMRCHKWIYNCSVELPDNDTIALFLCLLIIHLIYNCSHVEDSCYIWNSHGTNIWKSHATYECVKLFKESLHWRFSSFVCTNYQFSIKTLLSNHPPRHVGSNFPMHCKPMHWFGHSALPPPRGGSASFALSESLSHACILCFPLVNLCEYQELKMPPHSIRS